MAKKRRKKESSAEEVTPVDTEAAPEAEPTTEAETVEVAVDEAPQEVTPEDSPESDTPAEEEAVEEVVSDENTEPSSEEETPEETPAEAEEASAESTGEEPDLRYELKQVLEAIMFASQKPLSAKEIISVLKGAAETDKENPNSHATPFAKVKEPQLRAAIEELELDYSGPGRTYEVRESAAGWQLVTKPDYAPWLRQLFPENRSARLSAPAMETLAIIAYRQPITRADIEAVRGVAVDGVMQTLLDRGLIKIGGRADIPGRPLLYGTTQNFMEHFGLKHLDDLPNAGELRKISLPTAEPPPSDESKATPPKTEVAPAEALQPATEPTPEASVASTEIPSSEESDTPVEPETSSSEEPVTEPDAIVETEAVEVASEEPVEPSTEENEPPVQS